MKKINIFDNRWRHWCILSTLIMVLSLIIFPKMEWRDHFPLEIYLFPGILSWEMGLKGHISTRGEAECGNQPRKSHFPTKYVWKKVNWKWKKVKLPIFGKIIKEIAFFDFYRFFKIAALCYLSSSLSRQHSDKLLSLRIKRKWILKAKWRISSTRYEL